MIPPDPLKNIRIVLARPSHPGNIGATARAMKTMGLSDLRLVLPRHFPHPDALARAAGASDILENAKVVQKGKKNTWVVVSRSGALAIADELGTQKERYKVPYGALLSKNTGDDVKAGDIVAQWDPHTHPIITEVKGKVNAKAYYSNYVTGFSERQFIVKEMFADGDKLVKHWQFKGKHTGTFFGIPATGKTVDVIGCTIAKMKDGKIAEEQDFMDNMVFMQQLGLLPAAQ